jgi:hypothetical protein
LSFSTTVMEGQAALIDRACQAIARLDLDAVLTLGPAVDLDAAHVPARHGRSDRRARPDRTAAEALERVGRRA